MNTAKVNKLSARGFTLVELIVVIVIIGILSIFAVPRFIDISSDAKVASIKGIASQIEATVSLARNKARVSGLRPVTTNPAGPSGNLQPEFVVDFGFGSAEVDFRNLCPESIAENSDRLRLLDFIDISGDKIQVRVDNRYTALGFELPASGFSTSQGCFVLYDSQSSPDCTIAIVTNTC
ncbi:prepilin-type N-terminal cleavage/methylation domain-containing protein [Glaciecola siphonariae]|uniref:Prepilin-type N-terminal cleavage/methylation domain-containing protein n=1 Tax=Glaciecola siphonariae TaxID=521012 RepID=A0ABV9LUP9_9ALTE